MNMPKFLFLGLYLLLSQLKPNVLLAAESTLEDYWNTLKNQCLNNLEKQSTHNRLAAEIVYLCAQVMMLEHRLFFLSDIPQIKWEQTFPSDTASKNLNPFSTAPERPFLNREEALKKLNATIEQIAQQTEQYCQSLEIKKKNLLQDPTPEKPKGSKIWVESLPQIFEKASVFCNELKPLLQALTTKIAEINAPIPKPNEEKLP